MNVANGSSTSLATQITARFTAPEKHFANLSIQGPHIRQTQGPTEITSTMQESIQMILMKVKNPQIFCQTDFLLT